MKISPSASVKTTIRTTPATSPAFITRKKCLTNLKYLDKLLLNQLGLLSPVLYHSPYDN